MDFFNYSLDFPGVSWVGPVLGTIVFFYGGWPFLVGAVREVRDRAPGMMLLVAMAITVGFIASLATTLGAFNLDFWWELSALVTIMLLGHWQEMKAIGQARGALAALADGHIVDGGAEMDESMITGESRPVPRQAGGRVVAGTVATDSAIRVEIDAVGEDTALPSVPAPMSRSNRRGWSSASSDPRGITGIIRLSKASYRKMLQNLAWAAGYNVVAIPLAAGVFAWAGVALSPAAAAVLMSASTIVVALNARLLRADPGRTVDVVSCPGWPRVAGSP